MAAAEAKTNDAEAPAPPKIVYATNPEPTVAHGAAKDVTDCDYGRLLLRRWGVPKSRFIGNMLVLYKSSSGKPELMLGPYWTMLLGVTVPLSIIMPALICAFLLSTKVHMGCRSPTGDCVVDGVCTRISLVAEPGTSGEAGLNSRCARMASPSWRGSERTDLCEINPEHVLGETAPPRHRAGVASTGG